MSTALEDDLLGTAIEAAVKASSVLREMQRSIESLGATQKESNREIVTAADLASEDQILGILRTGPRATIVTEENFPDVPRGDGVTWIVDPLDGSSAYFHGLDTYAVSIAAWRDEEPLIGVVALPAKGDVCQAVAGRGAYGPAGPLRVSNHGRSSAVVSIGASVLRSMLEGTWHDESELREAVTQAQGVRIAASCAQDLLFVAQGQVDLFFAARQRQWDYAAGVLLVREAGGRVWTSDAGPGRRNILVANTRLDFLTKLAGHMVGL